MNISRAQLFLKGEKEELEEVRGPLDLLGGTMYNFAHFGLTIHSSEKRGLRST